MENTPRADCAGQISAREAAAARGDKTYMPTEQCKRGHISARYVANGGCIECMTRFHNRVKGPNAAVNHPQLQRFILGIPYEWGKVWGQEHTNAATQYLQGHLDALLVEWSKSRA